MNIHIQYLTKILMIIGFDELKMNIIKTRKMKSCLQLVYSYFALYFIPTSQC